MWSGAFLPLSGSSSSPSYWQVHARKGQIENDDDDDDDYNIMMMVIIITTTTIIITIILIIIIIMIMQAVATAFVTWDDVATGSRGHSDTRRCDGSVAA